MPRTALKIAGARADEGLPFSDHALTAAPADRAVGVHHDSPCLHEDLQQALLQRLAVDPGTGGDDQKAHCIGDLSAFQDGSACTEVLNSSVVAGAEKRLVDMRAEALNCRDHLIDKVGLCHNRHDLREVDVIGLGVNSVRVGAEDVLGCSAPLSQLVQGDLIRLHEGGFRPRLHAEVADGNAVGHGEGL